MNIPDIVATAPPQLTEPAITAEAEADAAESMRCPTCRAQQPWSDECRRCGSDLSLLRRLAAQCRRHRWHTLRALRTGRFAEAINHARQLHHQRPDPSAVHLLAVCLLLNGQFANALRVAASDVNAL